MTRPPAGRLALAAFCLLTGAAHFVFWDSYLKMIPEGLPSPAFWNLLSGLAELAGALGLLYEPTRRAAAWGLVALLVAVFPANLQMLWKPLWDLPAWFYWARLPLQGLFIGWAWSQTRP
jgi:uncharacterized membrane protein